ncbi:transcriptional adapter 2-alpha-like [Littorina saxatilis]|uniref:Transcriptional adapter n=1 Tax=Littorina saxatilis TaxID=31220 RepID=A0AAN9AJC0_9CAEN
MENFDDSEAQCPGCSSHLMAPFIRCAQCPIRTHLCLHCFARGAEFEQHQNNHSYTVVKYDFPLYENHWTAEDEMKLLESVENFGYGNWPDVSAQLQNKSPSECERHYNKCYINCPEGQLPAFPEYEPDIFPSPVVFKLSEDPPRPPEGSPLCLEMAGYSAARGDFTVQYNNFAEMDVCNLTFEPEDRGEDDEEDVEIMDDLKMALLHSYRYRLKERHRIKRIVKDYGLINLQKLMRFHHYGMDRDVRQQISDLRVFTTLMTPLDNDKLHEGIQYEHELRSQISRLQEYRDNGLKRLRSIQLYRLLRSRRSTSRQKRHLFSDVVAHIRDDAACQAWLQRNIAGNDRSNRIIPLPSAPRKVAPPIEISGLTGYDKLSPTERELCQTVRLVPEAFLEFRNILVNECRKHCGLRLAQARTLIKIDVNKTRKLYDFLLQEGQVNKPS